MLLKIMYIPEFHFRSEYWLFWVQEDQWNSDEFQYTFRSYIYWRVGGISSCFFSCIFFFLPFFMQYVQHFFFLFITYTYICKLQYTTLLMITTQKANENHLTIYGLNLYVKANKNNISYVIHTWMLKKGYMLHLKL